MRGLGWQSNYLKLNPVNTPRFKSLALKKKPMGFLTISVSSWDLGFASCVSSGGTDGYIPTGATATECTLSGAPHASWVGLQITGHRRGGICTAWELGGAGRA